MATTTVSTREWLGHRKGLTAGTGTALAVGIGLVAVGAVDFATKVWRPLRTGRVEATVTHVEPKGQEFMTVNNKYDVTATYTIDGETRTFTYRAHDSDSGANRPPHEWGAKFTLYYEEKNPRNIGGTPETDPKVGPWCLGFGVPILLFAILWSLTVVGDWERRHTRPCTRPLNDP